MNQLLTSLQQQLIDLGKEAESRSAEIEANRCVSDDLIEKLKATGALRLWVAQEYGGHQADIQALIDAIQTLAYYNGSLGWILGVTGTASLGSGYLQPKAASEIFGHPNAQIGGWAAPAAIGKKVEGGLLVSGKWSWGSGIRHCSHIVAGVLVAQEGTDRKQSAIIYIDPKEVTFIDNWQVLGVRGSNSIDYELKNCFIPDDKWVWFPIAKPAIDAPLYRFSFMGALASGVAAVSLGLAARALDEIKTLCLSKKPKGASRTLAERPVVHDKIARMEAAYQSAKLFLQAAIEKNWKATLEANQTATTKSELRLAATYAVEECAKIVSEAYHLGGGSSIWDGVKLQELFRDANTITQHGLVASPVFEIAGRVSFGLKVNEWLL